MVEFSSVEIGVQFVVDPFEEIQIKSFCDAFLIVIGGEDGMRAFFKSRPIRTMSPGLR
jgi:hypothetical protein